MSNQILELRRKRAGVVAKLDHMMSLADGEKRGLNEQEEKDYELFMGEIEGLDKDIERRERVANLSGGLGQSANGGTRPNPDPTIGMGKRDVERYSLRRAIVAAADAPKNPRAWDGARLEFEASQATAERLGMSPQGFFVPWDWVQNRDSMRMYDARSGWRYEARDLVKGTTTAGGHLVDTVLLAENFIDLLRNQMMVQRAGATILTGLVGDIAIPRQTGGATAYWVAESGAPTESQQAFDQVTMTPKTVGAYTDYSRKLLKQSSIDVESFVRGDLSMVQALAIDLASLHGSGSSNQPTGVAATSGIGSVAGGTNGAAPTWANIIALETEVAQDNADIGRVAYMTNTKVRGKLKGTEKFSSTGFPVWSESPSTPLNGYPGWVTNQVSSTLTKGSSSGVCSAIFFGNWADLLIGMWGGLDILVDPYTGGTSGTVRVVALQDVDIAVRHPESFAAMLDALTS